jgi:hypothetical protein
MATQKGASGLVSRAVREALSTLVSPQLCEQLISRSLASQGLSAVPESGTEIGEWLEGSLRGEVETTVGPDAADLMMMQLGPIAAYAAIAMPSMPMASLPVPDPAFKISDRVPSGRTPSDPDALDDDRPTDLRFDVSAEPVWAPASGPPNQRQPARAAAFDPFASDPPTGVFAAPQAAVETVRKAPLRRGSEPPVVARAPEGALRPPRPDARGETTRPAAPEATASDLGKSLPLVLTASGNREALGGLRRYLSSTASVVHVPDLVGLLDALEEPEVLEPIVLIDCHHPTVHISSVSAIGEDLPRGTTVVLWGVDDATWEQLDRERSPACRWVRCSSEATTDDVGSLCSMLLG